VELLSTGGLACGLSASALYDLSDPPDAPAVLVLRGSRTRGRGRHTTRELPSYECVVVDGLRSLSPMRAILDSVHRISRNDAVALVESAIVRRLVKPIALGRRATELSNAKRPGCAVTLRILADLHPELSLSRNKWEALVARRAKQYGLALPRLEHELWFGGRRYFADAAWPAQRVALEFDGRDPHMRRAVHDYDSGRRNDFVDAGWLRFAITASALRNRDDRAFQQVARAVNRRRAADVRGPTRASHA
jgi:very-short-patch-repair endonuclease